MINTGRDIAFHTLGCKLNYAETSTISRSMEDAGFNAVAFNERADVYVINTCSVTDNADKKCRNVVRRAMKRNPDAYVVVIGCYAQLKPTEISEIEGVDLVLGAAEKFRLPEILNDLTKNSCGQVRSTDINEVNIFIGGYSAGERTRSFLKIQDGCDYNCSFCTIPLARGRSRSDTIENIMKNASEIASRGVKEIVLTGVNIGDYGKGIDRHAEFFDVVKMLDTIKGIERIRISSIEPNLLKNEMIDFVAQSRIFMPHFHIPLQSGSNKVLGMMRRRYRRELYTDRVTKIRSTMPYACIGADVIVGFPGESDEDFLETYHYLNELDIAYLHVFTYSERPDTHAVKLGSPVPGNVRHDRSAMLRSLSDKKRRAFYTESNHQSRKVLFEGDRKDGLIFGFSDNYIRVGVPDDDSLEGQMADVYFNGVNDELYVDGKLVEITTTV